MKRVVAECVSPTEAASQMIRQWVFAAFRSARDPVTVKRGESKEQSEACTGAKRARRGDAGGVRFVTKFVRCIDGVGIGMGEDTAGNVAVYAKAPTIDMPAAPMRT